jgi:hypothetical protein
VTRKLGGLGILYFIILITYSVLLGNCHSNFEKEECSNLPLIMIDTHGNQILDEPKISAKMRIIYDKSGRKNVVPRNRIDFEGKIGIEIRGQSSLRFPKKQYRFEIWGKKGNDLAVSLLGLPADSDWILYGPYSDKTLMRNFLAYKLSNNIGRYAPRTKFVELYLNETGASELSTTYAGVYLLVETIKIAKRRVDIHPLNPRHKGNRYVSGGYILKIDTVNQDDPYFITDFGTRIIIEAPNRDQLNIEQMTWIKNYMNEFEHALDSDEFDSPDKGYTRYIDVDTFVDFFLLNELLKNIDAYSKSTYIHKDRGEPLAMGPIWDFNIAIGNADDFDGWDTDGWLLDVLLPYGPIPICFWFYRLLEDPLFVQKLVGRWQALRRSEFYTPTIEAIIDDTARCLEQAQQRNFARWPVLGMRVWPNPGPYGMSYQEEVDGMKRWLNKRMLWIDQNIEKLQP